MLKKSTYFILLILILISGTSAFFYGASAPPAGAHGGPPFFVTCNTAGCHNSFTSNTAGGGVELIGLPTTQYVPGGPASNFSFKITHGTADRSKWGFSITAKTLGGVSVGTWSSTNPNVAPTVDGSELRHIISPLTALQNTYTFNNLKWTPPATNVGQIAFYYAAVAANNDAPFTAPTGDYVYSGLKTSVLPVKLYSFNAIIKKNQVLLSWQTVQELNSHYFTIQKSYDNRQFSDIGKVYSAGNSSVSKNYNFTDENPSYFEKPIYYRLVMVDKDGSKEYSPIENVILKSTATFIKSIYPNPLKSGGTLYIDFVSKENETVSIRLIDHNGKMIKSIQNPVLKGSNILNILLPLAAAGKYNLIVTGSNEIFKESFIIQ